MLHHHYSLGGCYFCSHLFLLSDVKKVTKIQQQGSYQSQEVALFLVESDIIHENETLTSTAT